MSKYDTDKIIAVSATAYPIYMHSLMVYTCHVSTHLNNTHNDLHMINYYNIPTTDINTLSKMNTLTRQFVAIQKYSLIKVYCY